MKSLHLLVPCLSIPFIAISFAAQTTDATVDSKSQPSTEPEANQQCNNHDGDNKQRNGDFNTITWPLENFKTRLLTVPDNTNDNNDSKQRSLTIEKLSSYPPIFRIKNFLTTEECLMLRRQACTGKHGIQDGCVDSDSGLGSGGSKEKRKMGLFDANNDGRLNANELIRMMDDFFESHVTEDDIRAMLSLIQLPLVVDGGATEASVSIQDFVRSDTAAIRRFFLTLMEEDPSKRSRHSRMAWLTSHGSTTDPEGARVMTAIQKRVALLTRLPETVVHRAMELQVVHYEHGDTNNTTTKGGGHYTAHFDSLSQSPLHCCHITHRLPPCRPCRLATLLYSLSDVDKGGHTAFPLATETRHKHTAESVEAWRMSSDSRESSYCAQDGQGLRIRPQLGQAILWYNHDITHLQSPTESRVPSLLGELDRSTLHAGCPSSTTPSTQSSTLPWEAPGKWIANHWIEASDILGEDGKHYASMIDS